MFVKLGISIVFFLVVLACGCSSQSAGGQNPGLANAPQTAPTPPSNTPAAIPTTNSETKPQSAASPSSGQAYSEGCALIEKSELEAVQSGKVQGAVPSRRDGNALAISQCYYTIFSSDGSKNLSVHLEVMQNDPKVPNQNAVGDLWKKFHDAKGTKKMEKPKSVPGVGDEAYWVGNNKSGALYALKKGKVVRVSVGGPDAEATKIEKSKKLAANVLKRLT